MEVVTDLCKSIDVSSAEFCVIDSKIEPPQIERSPIGPPNALSRSSKCGRRYQNKFPNALSKLHLHKL
jgi:hypothetical protein